ncbi:MAG: glycosyltransferase family 4 protein [Prevotella sp.]|nr:glycosyltransferase family 4 protein [Prevotella sp.]
MKLAILTCGMLPIPAVQGGAVENLIDFYLEYNNRKKLHDITVYSPWDPRVSSHPALTSNVNHYHFIDVTSLKARLARRIGKFFHSPEDYYNHYIEFYFEQAYRHLKKQQYDYIILENGAGLAYKLSQRGHKNLILHLHNDLLNSSSRYHDIIFTSLVKIITVSDFIKERVSTIEPSDKILTVHNGIDLAKFTPPSQGENNLRNHTIKRKEIGFNEDDFVLVYSGRINRDKGISEFIDAMHQLKKFPQIKLMVLGSSFFEDATSENEFISNLKQKSEDIKKNIIFTGFIPYQQVPAYLHLADIAVLPSMWDEPFGLTIVEAMAVGLPLITTRSGGIPEICEGVATIVDRDDVVNNLTTAITDLYLHPEKRKQMSAASLERAKLFDKETFAKNFFAALEGL